MRDRSVAELIRLECVRPRWRPSELVGWLLASRLEGYREHTEAWPHRHGIRFDHLVVLNRPNAEARHRARAYGSTKASLYWQGPAVLFIESEPSQAHEITELSGKDVLCLPTSELMLPAESDQPTCPRLRGLRGLRHLHHR